jgi:hypothetical protein
MVEKGVIEFKMKNGKEISEAVKEFLKKTLQSAPDNRMTWG